MKQFAHSQSPSHWWSRYSIPGSYLLMTSLFCPNILPVRLELVILTFPSASESRGRLGKVHLLECEPKRLIQEGEGRSTFLIVLSCPQPGDSDTNCLQNQQRGLPPTRRKLYPSVGEAFIKRYSFSHCP